MPIPSSAWLVPQLTMSAQARRPWGVAGLTAGCRQALPRSFESVLPLLPEPIVVPSPFGSSGIWLKPGEVHVHTCYADLEFQARPSHGGNAVMSRAARWGS